MTIVEKNDVDVSRLFYWSKESTIKGPKGKNKKVYVRLLGDADLNRARVMALRKSAELRKILKDTNSDERIAYIPFAEELTKEMMVESTLLLTMREVTHQALNEVTVPLPKEPGSNAPTERLEQFQKEVDEYPQKRDEAIRAVMEGIIAEKREKLSAKSEEELYDIYTAVLIKELCEQELLKRFKEYCIYFGTFSDKAMTDRFMNTFEDLDNLPAPIKESLEQDYSLLEIESEQLKK